MLHLGDFVCTWPPASSAMRMSKYGGGRTAVHHRQSVDSVAPGTELDTAVHGHTATMRLMIETTRDWTRVYHVP